MRLAISNIAWDTTEDEAIAGLLRRFNIDAIDVAPGKYFTDPLTTQDVDIKKVRQWWAAHDIEITGMQALLFGTTGLNLFGEPAVQHAMLKHLAAICRIGSGLGATRLVFGSPKNRDRSQVTDQEVQDIASTFFTRLGDIAKAHGVYICLEPNPLCYGANFMVNSTETAQIVEQVAHPAIKMQLDTGAITLNHENIDLVLKHYAHLIGHIHASEPDLLPLGDSHTQHDKIYTALQYYLPEHVVTIEMLATQHEPHLLSVERALNAAVKSYHEKGNPI